MNTTIPEGTGFFPRLLAMLRRRCPRCFRGKVFNGIFTMNEPCPVCEHVFQREEGYFLGAMYVSYVLGSGIVALAFFAAITIWPNVDTMTMCLYLMFSYIPLMPIVFQYSRVIWMHLDYLVTPGELDSQAARRKKAGL